MWTGYGGQDYRRRDAFVEASGFLSAQDMKNLRATSRTGREAVPLVRCARRPPPPILRPYTQRVLESDVWAACDGAVSPRGPCPRRADEMWYFHESCCYRLRAHCVFEAFRNLDLPGLEAMFAYVVHPTPWHMEDMLNSVAAALDFQEPARDVILQELLRFLRGLGRMPQRVVDSLKHSASEWNPNPSQARARRVLAALNIGWQQ